MKVFPIFQKDNQIKIELILKHKNERDYILWLIGTHTGLRIGDILRLKVSDIETQFLSVKEQKTDKQKTIKLSQKLREALFCYIKNTKLSSADFLFPSRQSKGRPMSSRRVQQIIKKTGKLAGLTENINTHSMRKTFAYNLYTLSKNNIALVMMALNHTKESITLKYLCIQDQLLNDLVELL